MVDVSSSPGASEKRALKTAALERRAPPTVPKFFQAPRSLCGSRRVFGEGGRAIVLPSSPALREFSCARRYRGETRRVYARQRPRVDLFSLPSGHVPGPSYRRHAPPCEPFHQVRGPRGPEWNAGALGDPALRTSEFARSQGGPMAPGRSPSWTGDLRRRFLFKVAGIGVVEKGGGPGWFPMTGRQSRQPPFRGGVPWEINSNCSKPVLPRRGARASLSYGRRSGARFSGRRDSASFGNRHSPSTQSR